MTTLAQDVVGVFKDAGAEQVFQLARAMRVSVNRTSKVMAHPLEDGSSVIDHTVINPVDAQLLLILPGENYKDLYAVIKGFFVARELLTLQTRTDSLPNMFIADMPHEETADMMDAVQIVLRMQEAVFFKRQAGATIAPRSTRSSTTTRRGEQTGRQSSVAYDLFKK